MSKNFEEESDQQGEELIEITEDERSYNSNQNKPETTITSKKSSKGKVLLRIIFCLSLIILVSVLGVRLYNNHISELDNNKLGRSYFKKEDIILEDEWQYEFLAKAIASTQDFRGKTRKDLNFTQVYVGQKDGYKTKDFKKKCFDLENILILERTKDKTIFGGFSTKPFSQYKSVELWNKTEVMKKRFQQSKITEKDENIVLLTLTNSTFFHPPKVDEYIIYQSHDTLMFEALELGSRIRYGYSLMTSDMPVDPRISELFPRDIEVYQITENTNKE